jgi:CelD/BcsL family acetyltransferase involved in cellulose biosynthesis
MRRLRIATTVAELDTLRPLWETLESGSVATMFQSFLWNVTAARHFGDREQLLVIGLESDSGAVIVPAVQSGATRAGFLGELLFDYRDVLAKGDPGMIPQAMAELGRRGLALSLTAMRAGNLLGSANIGSVEPWVGAPCLRRADITGDAFLAEHFKARKQMRRLRRIGAAFHRYKGDATALLKWVYDRKAEQFAGDANDIFSDQKRRQCMVEIARASGKLCDIFTIESGSAIVAALVTFRDRGVRRFYTIWYDARREEFSPGIVLLLHACHESLTEGLDVDFLTGEQPHKTRFATSSVQLYRLNAVAADLLGASAAATLAA